MEILNVISVREKVKELVDITLKMGVNGANKSFPIQELTKLETALLEGEKCNAALKERVAELQHRERSLERESLTREISSLLLSVDNSRGKTRNLKKGKLKIPIIIILRKTKTKYPNESGKSKSNYSKR